MLDYQSVSCSYVLSHLRISVRLEVFECFFQKGELPAPTPPVLCHDKGGFCKCCNAASGKLRRPAGGDEAGEGTRSREVVVGGVVGAGHRVNVDIQTLCQRRTLHTRHTYTIYFLLTQRWLRYTNCTQASPCYHS